MQNSIDLRKKIEGFSLIEVLISVILIMIIGVGSAATLSLKKQIQRDNAAQSLAIIEVRNLMSSATSGNCDGDGVVTIGSAGYNMSIECLMTTSRYTVSGTSSGAALPNVTVDITRPEVETSADDPDTTKFIKHPIRVAP